MADGFLGGLLGGGVGSIVGGSVVRLFLDTGQFDKALATSQAKNKTASGTMASGWAKFGMIAAAGAAAAGIALVKFAADSIKAASDQAESQNKVNVVFQEGAETVNRFAETSAKAFGISKTAAFEASSAFGNMMLTAGIAVDEADDMSVRLVQLAADMASFNNQDPSEMLEKLRAGLAGEAEPLRKVGVLLSEARVKQEAYDMGIAKIGATLTEGQKVQARYNLILRDTTVQHGDFARTASGLANQQRILSAQFADMQAEVGVKLLPAMVALMGAANDLIPVLSPLLVDAFTAIADSATSLSAVIKALQGDISALTDVNFGFLGSMLELLPATEGLGKGLGLVGQAVDQHKAAEEARQKVLDDATKSLDEYFAATTNAGEATETTGRKVRRFTNMTKDDFKKWRDGLSESFSDVEGMFSDLADKAHLTARQVLRAFTRQIRAQNEYAENWETLNKRKLPDELRTQLADMGLDGANIVAALAEANRTQFNKIVEKWTTVGNRADTIAGKIANIGGALDSLPKRKTIDIDVNIRSRAYGSSNPALDQEIADQIRRNTSTP